MGLTPKNIMAKWVNYIPRQDLGNLVQVFINPQSSSYTMCHPGSSE